MGVRGRVGKPSLSNFKARESSLKINKLIEN
jgi:hypothetical protein